MTASSPMINFVQKRSSEVTMKNFKHHSQFARPDADQRHLFPDVLQLPKMFRKPACESPGLCPQCRKEMVKLDREFSAPKMTDIEQWRKVEFLAGKSFKFHSVHAPNGSLFSYPASVAGAKVFAEKYVSRWGWMTSALGPRLPSLRWQPSARDGRPSRTGHPSSQNLRGSEGSSDLRVISSPSA